MESRRQNVPEDRQAILGRHSGNPNAEAISHDLFIKILLRLPVKSIARCRCLSKLWASILDRPYFTETFLTRSSARPKLLFASAKDGKLFFFTSPQPQNPDEISLPIAANYHMSFPCDDVFDIYSPIRGLVCVKDNRMLKGRKTPAMVLEICNLSTGQSFVLPRMKSRKRTGAKSFFGYDPTQKQFKVLSMMMSPLPRGDQISVEHQVLTLGRGSVEWRMVECGIPHRPIAKSICINGVLYYQAWVYGSNSKDDGIICFDVRYEKFSFTKVMEPSITVGTSTLINYNGKLGSVISEGKNYICGRSASFVMWVLQDPEKQEWSKHVYELPFPWWWHVVGCVTFIGVTGTNEIVLSPYSPSYPFYVVYYNLERKTITRVEIQGMGAFRTLMLYTFVDHVEDMKLM